MSASPNSTSNAGFTLVELLVVTAVIGILAGVAVPNLVTSRNAANERAVLATLRTIATAQAQVMTTRALDSDHDGVGEALSLPELAGTDDLRGTSTRLDPTALSAALGTALANGFVSTKGYLIALYLPDASGDGVLGTSANSASIDADGAEHTWSCLAWPLTRGTSGAATFFINQEGEVLASRSSTYTGSLNPPPAGAALMGVASTSIVGGVLASNQTGADGNLWTSMQ